MSLLVCSSEQSRYHKKEIGVSRPFSFTNYLPNAMIIPPKSEVAVQSVKYERSGKYEVVKGENDVGFVDFGPAYTDGEDFTRNSSQSLLQFTLDEGTYNEDGLKKALKSALDKMCLWHPDLKAGAVSIQSYTDERFKGFTFSLSQKSTTLDDGGTLTPYGLLITNSDGSTGKFEGEPSFVGSADGSTITGFSGSGTSFRWLGRNTTDNAGSNTAIFPERMMSFQGSDMTISIANATQVSWCIGLVRAQACGNAHQGRGSAGNRQYDYYKNYIGPVSSGYGLPSACENEHDPNLDPDDLGLNEINFWDYCVASVYDEDDDKHYLRVYANCFDDPDEEQQAEKTNFNTEIEYWEDSGSDLTGSGPYDLDTNSESISDIHFEVKGNEVLVSTKKGNADHHLFVRSRRDTIYSYPPITSTKLRLHMKLQIDNDSTKYLQWDTRNITGRDYTTAQEQKDRGYGKGWYEEHEDNMAEYGGESSFDSDTRPSNATFGWEGEVLSIDGSSEIQGTFTIYTNPEDEDDEDPHINPPELTASAGVYDLMGFYSHIINESDGTKTDTSVEWSSEFAPEGVASSTIFVSCPTLTQLSHNFGHGTPSKIIHHCPLFDNTGRSTGPLFFETSEKTYLRLGNTEPISLNQLQLDLVNSDETLVDDIKGNTTIVLHIRQRR